METSHVHYRLSMVGPAECGRSGALQFTKTVYQVTCPECLIGARGRSKQRTTQTVIAVIVGVVVLIPVLTVAILLASVW